MLKRIIFLEKNKKSKKRKMISKISDPIEESCISKSQLQHTKDYVIIDADKITENNRKKIEKRNQKYDYIWDEEAQSIRIEEINLPFERMNLEQKVDFLYNTLIKPTLPPDEEEELLDETDE